MLGQRGVHTYATLKGYRRCIQTYSIVKLALRGMITILFLTVTVLPSAAQKATTPLDVWNPDGLATQSDDSESTDPQVTILSSAADSLRVELSTPTYKVHYDEDDLGECIDISVSGYGHSSMVGEPRLPIRATLVGLPLDADISLRIVATTAVTWQPESRVCRVTPPSAGQFGLDPSMLFNPRERPAGIPGVTDALAADPAVLGDIGFVRSQRVVPVVFHPFHYDAATGIVMHVSNIVVDVVFSTDGETAPQTSQLAPRAILPQESDAFESMLQDLVINYQDASDWRSTPAQSTATVLSTESARWTSTAEDPLYKIAVRDEGLYNLTYGDLTAADPSVDVQGTLLSEIQMLNQGQEVAIQIIGDTDGYFGSEDTILFYGEAVASKYTDINVYWLTWTSGDRLRMSVVDGTPGGILPTSDHFTDTLHLEVNNWYWTHKPEIESDRWYWDYLSGSKPSVSHDFELRDLANEPQKAFVGGLIQGYKADLTQASPHHSIEIDLNGRTILTDTWPPGITYQFGVSVPADHLIEGENTITITGGLDTSFDSFLTNWLEIEYGRDYVAAGDRLLFETEDQARQYQVTGFTTDTLDILDITNPKEPAVIGDYQLTGGNSAYTVTFQYEATASHRYLLASYDHRLQPVTVQKVDLPELRTVQNGADYIIITHRDFHTATLPLADFHRDQGLRVGVVDVQDVYNVFNEGLIDPEAIRAFLTYAYAHWPAPAPSYVLLVGDGNRDPIDYNGRGEISYIPPYLADADPWMDETAADNRYVTVSGPDNMPDMHLGRLPVKTVAETEALVSKILAYNSPAAPADWNQATLFIADNAPDPAGDFYALSDTIVDSHLPEPYVVDKVYYGLTHTTVEVARAAITTTIDDGVLLVNYIGHGAVPTWANEGLLRLRDLAGLENAGKLPFVVPMTCLEGYFIYASDETQDRSSVGESFVRLPNTGAIASWSATGLGLASGHDYLNRALFDAIFKEDIIELGPATTYAKLYLYANSGGAYQDLLDTYILFGDPATRLNVLPVDAQIEQQMAAPAAGYEPGDPITYTLIYTNTGPATAHHVVVSNTISPQVMNPTIATSGMTATLRTNTAFTWDIADLAAGEGGVITITGTISETTEGILTSTAIIETTAKESEMSNNQTTITQFRYRTYLPLVIKTGAP